MYIVQKDKDYIRRRITEIESEIQAMGPDFEIAFNQSSETWHDNAPFDVLREKQHALAAERHKLRVLLAESPLSLLKPRKGRVGIGLRVVLSDGHIYEIAGDWTPRVGQHDGDALVLSTQSPLAQHLLGKRVGDVVGFGRHQTVAIDAVS